MNELRRSLLAIAATSIVLACAKRADRPSAASTGLRFLGADAGGDFARARTPRPFTFPADHGAHPAYRSEWWYFTGNLQSREGREFGFELTFFRYALAGATSVPRESPWATRQVWMAHLALTDASRQRFDAAERLSRGALDLAGARDDRFDVWVEDFSAAQADPDAPIRLAARTEAFGVDLVLDPGKAIVPQGDAGLDIKGPEDGNASYYYSWPRLAVTGNVRPVGETPVAVTGLAWLDREWSTSSLSGDVVGWDWFALQLSDGRDVMFYRLRDARGNATGASSGTLIAADGSLERLQADSVTLEPREWWTSPHTGARYPIVWRLGSEAHDLDLLIRPLLADQEIDLSVRYWEGAVSVESLDPASALSGRGYLELAGYAAD